MMPDMNSSLHGNQHEEVQKSKFHIGFPVDTASDTKYFLIYPHQRKHQLLEVGKKECERWNKKYEPEILKELGRVLPVNKFLFKRRGGDIPYDVKGSSASLSFVLASCSEKDVRADVTDETSPVFLFSVRFKTEPTCGNDIVLQRVTEGDGESDKNSLLQKWKAVEELSQKNRKVVLFLHHIDADILKKELRLQGGPSSQIKTEEIHCFFSQCSFWGDVDLDSPQPQLFALQDDEFRFLSYSLGISITKIESETKKTWKAVGSGLFAGASVAAAVASYFITKKKNK